jgi:hypothetical protein
MHAVDVFVFHDDAQYIKAGWVNRNRILLNSEPSWLTLPVNKGATSLPIDQRYYALDDNAVVAIKNRLRGCYAQAPEYDAIYPLLCGLLDYTDSNVASFNANLLIAIARKLGIGCNFASSSAMHVPMGLKGQDKVIDMCRRIGATRYINPIGGLALYNGEAFSDTGIELRFLQANPTGYAQFGSTYQPFLSIIDVLMFNPIERVRTMLDDYRLVVPGMVSFR